MSLVQGFNPNDHEKQAPLEALPDGWYRAMISETVEKENSKGTGAYLGLTWKVTRPEAHAGRKVWQTINLRHQNAKVVEIAQSELATVCDAIGITGPLQSAAELRNRECYIYVRTTKSKGDSRTEIKGVVARPPEGAQPAPDTAPQEPTQPATQPDDGLPF